jgi:hypothetical protein
MLMVQGSSAMASVFDSSAYKDMVDPSGFYFIDSGPGALEDLRTNGTALVSESFADYRYLVVGDRFPATIQLESFVDGSYQWETWDVDLEIIGMVKGLPGLYGWSSEIFVDSGTFDFIPDLNLTRGSQEIGWMLDLEGEANASAVASAATAILIDSGMPPYYVGVADDLIKDLRNDPGFAALSQYLYAEYAFSITIMTVGVGMLIFVAVSDREHELACILARGSTGSQLRKILMGESLTLMVIGLLVGLSVGLLTAFMFNTLATDQEFALVDRRLVVTLGTWLVVLASVASLLVASLVATARAGRIKLAEVLRVRGG